MDFKHLTPEAIGKLPSATVLQLVADTATHASADGLKLLLAAGVFDRQTDRESPWKHQSLSPSFHPCATPVVAALGHVLAGAASDFVTSEPSTGQVFNSTCAYEVHWLAVGDDFKAVFHDVVRRFIDQCRPLSATVLDLEFMGNCGVLLATASAMGEVRTMTFILDALDNGSSELPLLRREGVNEGLFSSDALHRCQESGLRRMWHPVRSAIAFSKPDCIDLFVARGWCPDASPFLSSKQSPPSEDGEFAVGTQNEATSIIEEMGHRSLSNATPKVVHRLLAALSPAALAASSAPEGDLHRWACGLFSGDVHESEMIEVALEFGIFDHAPADCLKQGALEGCWPVMAVALKRIDWDQPTGIDPIGDALASRWWCVGPMSERMKTLSERLIDALDDAGQAHRLLDQPHFSPAAAFAQKGAVGAMLRCIEVGSDPSVVMSTQNPQSPFTDGVVAALRSCQAKRIAESALAEIQLPCLRR